MKNLVLMLLVTFFQCSLTAQSTGSANEIIEEGIALHDAGKYEEAIAKYKQVLDVDSHNIRALYELSATYMYSGNNQGCIDLCKELQGMEIPESYAKDVYVNMGSAYDNLNMPDKAIETFERGLKKFPNFYLLYFNKGITLAKQEKGKEALQCFEDALKDKPLHVSSNYYAAFYNEGTNKIPSVLAAGLVIILSPESERAAYCTGIIQKALGGSVRKDSGNAMTIFLPAEGLTKKDKKAPNNFSMIEMTMSLMAGLEQSKEIDSIAKSRSDKLGLKMQMLINMLTNDAGKNKGFYWEHYVPFYTAMKSRDYVNTLAHMALQQTDDADNKNWIAAHQPDITAFLNWVKEYNWNNK